VLSLNPRAFGGSVGDDLEGEDEATITSIESYTQHAEASSELYLFYPNTSTWVRLAPAGLEARIGRAHHAAAVVDQDRLVVFGGWRQRRCGALLPCSELRNDVLVLRLRPFLEWEETPETDGVPPVPRAAHSMTRVGGWWGGVNGWAPEGGSTDRSVDATLVIFGGLGLVAGEASSIGREGAALNPRAVHLNDLHLLELLPMGGIRWRRLLASGSAPSPRSGHAATLSPSGDHLLIYGGIDSTHGALADLHTLDLRRGIWWQVHAADGEAAAGVRHAHASAMLAHELVIVGGLPAAAAVADAAVHAFDCRAAELRTDASLAVDEGAGSMLASDSVLNQSCKQLFGGVSTRAQTWQCHGLLAPDAGAQAHAA
jgi:hypothetical protein